MIQLSQVPNVGLANILHFLHCDNLVVQFSAENGSLRARAEPLDVCFGKNTNIFTPTHKRSI